MEYLMFLKSEYSTCPYRDRVDAPVRETKVSFACLLILNIAYCIFSALICYIPEVAIFSSKIGFVFIQ